MAIVGAILGDIAGSQYEFEKCKPIGGYDSETCELFTNRCVFTDDTVLTLAVKKAICEQRDFTEVFREMAHNYKYVGFGTGFHNWLYSDDSQPFNSCGNGSAMRISYIADLYDNEEKMKNVTHLSAACTHNHPEGIKGAVVAATCMWMARKGADKKAIEKYAVEQYPSKMYEFGCDRPIDEYKEYYKFDATCQGSIPVAIRCFLESENYEGTLRKAFSLNCDLDSVCCIAGGIAENYYGTTGFDNNSLLERYLDDELLYILQKL